MQQQLILTIATGTLILVGGGWWWWYLALDRFDEYKKVEYTTVKEFSPSWKSQAAKFCPQISKEKKKKIRKLDSLNSVVLGSNDLVKTPVHRFNSRASTARIIQIKGPCWGLKFKLNWISNFQFSTGQMVITVYSKSGRLYYKKLKSIRHWWPKQPIVWRVIEIAPLAAVAKYKRSTLQLSIANWRRVKSSSTANCSNRQSKKHRNNSKR